MKCLSKKSHIINFRLVSVEFINEKSLKFSSQTENNSFKFTFDRVFTCNCTQEEVFHYSAEPILESKHKLTRLGVLEGFNGTIFAYGQTSSGKTHTMTGVVNHPELEGITPRVAKYIFNHIENFSEDIEYTLKVSMIEIYMEKIRV